MKFLACLLLPLSLLAQPKQDRRYDNTNAVQFLKSLDASQKTKATFSFKETTRFDWHYLPASQVTRTGLSLKELDTLQRSKVYALLKQFLSVKGYNRSKDIMQYEYLLREMEPTNKSRIPENYYISIYGDPAVDTTWGWKITGHHLALNFTIVNNQLAFAPFFFGVYPAIVPAGPMQGRRLLKDEEELGFQLVNSLNESQKSKAIFAATTFNDIVSKAEPKAIPLDNQGVAREALDEKQKLLLEQLLITYLSAMPEDQAKARLKRINKEDINQIVFAWAGSLTQGKPHYYRIQGKSFLIEFDNSQHDANHIHTVWRDFNGDYGDDLIREHYKNEAH